MKKVELRLPEVGLFAMTRAAFSVGVGLLLSSKLDQGQRRAVGIALVLVGVLTTVPFAVRFLSDES